MSTEVSTLLFECPTCKNQLEASMVRERGGINDSGWWIIECSECESIFSNYVGKDVNDSHLRSGGKIIKKLDKDCYTEEEVKAEVEKLQKK